MIETFEKAYERKCISLPPGIVDDVESVREKDESFSGIVAMLLKKEVLRRKKCHS